MQALARPADEVEAAGKEFSQKKLQRPPPVRYNPLELRFNESLVALGQVP